MPTEKYFVQKKNCHITIKKTIINYLEYNTIRIYAIRIIILICY